MLSHDAVQEYLPSRRTMSAMEQFELASGSIDGAKGGPTATGRGAEAGHVHSANPGMLQPKRHSGDANA